MMSFRGFLTVMVAGALAVGVVNRLSDWSDDTYYTVSMATMVVLMLVCFPIMAPTDTLRRGPRKR